jgi:hypothetical protein
MLALPVRLYANNSTAEWIFMKFDLDVVPLEASPN